MLSLPYIFTAWFFFLYNSVNQGSLQWNRHILADAKEVSEINQARCSDYVKRKICHGQISDECKPPPSIVHIGRSNSKFADYFWFLCSYKIPVQYILLSLSFWRGGQHFVHINIFAKTDTEKWPHKAWINSVSYFIIKCHLTWSIYTEKIMSL